MRMQKILAFALVFGALSVMPALAQRQTAPATQTQNSTATVMV